MVGCLVLNFSYFVSSIGAREHSDSPTHNQMQCYQYYRATSC